MKVVKTKEFKSNEIQCAELSPACTGGKFIKSELSLRERETSTILRQGIHYAWKWGNIVFVHLNLFPGDTPGPSGNLSPDNSLTFLKTVIQQMDKDKDRMVLIHHFTFGDYTVNENSGIDWWTKEQRALYWQSIANVKVIGIFTGHAHRMPDKSPINNFNRPKDCISGPPFIPAFRVGAAGEGAYLDVRISNSSMKIIPMTASGAANLDPITLPLP